jgi:Protein of unknown function (DUF3626)
MGGETVVAPRRRPLGLLEDCLLDDEVAMAEVMTGAATAMQISKVSSDDVPFDEEEEELEEIDTTLNLSQDESLLENVDSAESAEDAAARASVETKKKKDILATKEERNSQQQIRDQIQQDLKLARQLEKEEQQRVSVSGNGTQEQKVHACLETCQQHALEYVKEKAKEKHYEMLPVLEAAVVENCGYTKEDLHQCLDYIRDEAPIVIHCTFATFYKLVRDTHYRNLFETGKSRGLNDPKKRKKWENVMFGGAYDDAKPFDRPKYGCLNVSGDVAGVPTALNYGQVVMTLQPYVRRRCTFHSWDTGDFQETETLGTNEYYAHVLSNYGVDELKALLDVCKNKRITGSASKCQIYKEVQIHGPICLATDILSLSFPMNQQVTHRAVQRKVHDFQTKTGCSVFWQEDILNRYYRYACKCRCCFRYWFCCFNVFKHRSGMCEQG